MALLCSVRAVWSADRQPSPGMLLCKGLNKKGRDAELCLLAFVRTDPCFHTRLTTRRTMVFALRLTLHSHCMLPTTYLIDLAWGTLEMHCGSVRSVASVAYMKSLEMLNFFVRQRFRRPIRLRLCKYTTVMLLGLGYNPGKHPGKLIPHTSHSLCHPLTDACSVNVRYFSSWECV